MRLLLLIIAFLLTNNAAEAQKICSNNKKKRAQQKTTLASPEENDYDVTGLKFQLELNNTSTDVTGMVTTHARTNINNFSLYAFELNGVFTIDSVVVNNNTYTNVSTTGSARKVSLTSSIAANTDFTATVYYHGTAPKGNGQFFTGGLNQVKLPSGSEILYSLSDDLYADDWWPCKQSLKDKIDSVEMTLIVPDSLKAASNGTLQSVVSVGNKKHYNWKTNYPIEYYLIAIAIGPYKEYNYHMHFTDGTNDSMLVQNFMLDSTTYMTPANKAIIDSTGLMIDHFSDLFGRYPFDDEKYGHAMTVLGGGMEHQTMTFMSMQNLRTTLVAHELGHQWWGNSVTYGSWEDIWLSEGLATYCEQLFLEHFQGNNAAKAARAGVFSQVMLVPGGSVWVNDTTTVNRIFDGRLTYNKGAAVTHMLRYMAPHDSLFFKGLRNYQQQFKYGTAVTTDMKTTMEQSYGIALDSFFRQWIYGEGYPTYSVQWAQENTVAHIKITQSTSHNSVGAFIMPVEVKLTSATGDTVVTIDVDGISSHFIFLWDKEITGVTVDPENHIINKIGSINNDPSVLSVSERNSNGVKIYPNPATSSWKVEQLQPNASLHLLDLNGKEIWTARNIRNALIPAHNLPAGSYILLIENEDGNRTYHKLLK